MEFYVVADEFCCFQSDWVHDRFDDNNGDCASVPTLSVWQMVRSMAYVCISPFFTT